MNSIISTLDKRSTWKNALIALGLFILNTILLDALDQPLLELASGEPKLDLRFGYDLETVEVLFSAYGEEGRSIYALNLLVDTPFPILGALATILFALLAFKHDLLRKVLILAPVVFMVADIVENILLYILLRGYPALSPTLVGITSPITQIKRAAFYISAVVLPFSVIVAATKVVKRN